MVRSRLVALLTLTVVIGALVVQTSPAEAGKVSEAPRPRCCMAMAYDAAAGQVVLFGGLLAPGSTAIGDTWTWDGTSWTKRFPDHSPPVRSGAAVAYDAAAGQVVLFGGTYGRFFNDTWMWNGSDWTRATPAHHPAARAYAAMAYDAADGKVVLFGGKGRRIFGDTWTWDGTDWTRQSPPSTPQPRSQAGIAYDADGRVMLFGGLDFLGGLLADTWTWDGTGWTQQFPEHSPDARRQPSVAYDSLRGEVVLFGGLVGDPLGDTWTWDGADWTQLAPAHSPPPRYGGGIAFDASHAQSVLFGGVVGEFGSGSTWAWDGTDWTDRPAADLVVGKKSGPPGTEFAAGAWGFVPGERLNVVFVDSVHGNTVLAQYTAGSDGNAPGMQGQVPANAKKGKQHIEVRGLSSGLVTKVAFTVT